MQYLTFQLTDQSEAFSNYYKSIFLCLAIYIFIVEEYQFCLEIPILSILIFVKEFH